MQTQKLYPNLALYVCYYGLLAKCSSWGIKVVKKVSKNRSSIPKNKREIANFKDYSQGYFSNTTYIGGKKGRQLSSSFAVVV